MQTLLMAVEVYCPNCDGVMRISNDRKSMSCCGVEYMAPTINVMTREEYFGLLGEFDEIKAELLAQAERTA